MPFVKDGQLDGSMARMRTSFPAALSARNGKASPEKFDPPPWQPMTTSGYSPASFICSFASCPMTVWCRSTWFKTLRSEEHTSELQSPCNLECRLLLETKRPCSDGRLLAHSGAPQGFHGHMIFARSLHTFVSQ